MNIILLFIINEAITKSSWDDVYLNLTLDYNQESKDMEQIKVLWVPGKENL